MPEERRTKSEQDSYLFQVNLGGMIDILSNHLYSSPDVFVRELLQNAVDAIQAKRNRGIQTENPDAVTLTLTQENGLPTLRFADTGTGLTESEIHRFLAVIGQSSKHDLTSGRIANDYIGRFGIGLLSCFLVSDCIRVVTRSMDTSEQTLEWCGKPDGTYTITPCAMRDTIGTTIVLTPKAGAEDYFTAERLTRLVQYYGRPLPEPIWLETDGSKTRLNPPLVSGDNTFAQVMQFGESLFGERFLDYIVLESPSGLFSGVAFILSSESAPTAKHSHRIYLKHMLLTEDGGRLLPKWAFFLRCFLNTTTLRPTASREDFYEDDMLLQAREELNDCLVRYLKRLATEKPGLLQKIVQIHQLAVQSVAVEDDALYQTFFPYLQFETPYGTLSGQVLLQADDPICYAAFEEFRQMMPIARAKHMMLVNAGYTYVRSLLERMYLLNPDIEVMSLQTLNPDTLLDAPKLDNASDALLLLAECNATLQSYDCAAGLKAFEPTDLPVLYMIDEKAMALRDIHRSMEMANAMFQGVLGALASEYHEQVGARLYLNVNNPLIQRLMTLRESERLRCCIEILYVQALLSGGYPMRHAERQMLNENLLQLLEWSL